ncbi:MoeZ/MoeB domain protein, partial [Teladorsagia circumcincta]
MYLAGAGVQILGIVDYDEVAIDNLHRQVAHKESMIGKPKVESLRETVNELNSDVKVVLHNILLDSECALDILRPYEIVVDCTDNPATRFSLRLRAFFHSCYKIPYLRYLLNDACVLLGKPLRSPCYRCLFPVPTNPAHVTNCSEGGVLGPVVGVIGSLQALEVLKIAAGLAPNFAGKLYLFDGSCGRSRTIQLRHRSKQCDVCGDNPTITELIDYVAFCGSGACDKIQNLSILPLEDRVTVTDYSRIRSSGPPILLDTRPAHEFAIASLEEAK